MKTAKIYKFNRKKYSLEENIDIKKPFVIEFEGELLKTKSGVIQRYDSHEKAENALITHVNKRIKELAEM